VVFKQYKTMKVPHFLETWGVVPQPDRQMKVQDYKEENVEEFVDNIFKLKRKYLYALL